MALRRVKHEKMTWSYSSETICRSVIIDGSDGAYARLGFGGCSCKCIQVWNVVRRFIRVIIMAYIAYVRAIRGEYANRPTSAEVLVQKLDKWSVSAFQLNSSKRICQTWYKGIDVPDVQSRDIMHHIKCVRPFVTLRPTSIIASPTTITHPCLHKSSNIVKYIAVAFGTCKKEVCDILASSFTRNDGDSEIINYTWSGDVKTASCKKVCCAQA